MSEHRSLNFLSQIWAGYTFKKGDWPAPLNNMQAADLRTYLADDATEYFNSGVLSLSDALGRLGSEAWSWSIIKLYYAVYYFAKSYLAMDGYGLYYAGRTAVWIEAKGGNQGKVVSGSRKVSNDPLNNNKKGTAGSHNALLALLEQEYQSSSLVNQEIEGMFPTIWMMEHREYANYKARGFVDPRIPKVFNALSQLGVRRALASYVRSDDLAFDPDHAIVAYPLLFFKMSCVKVRGNNNYKEVFDEEKMALVRKLAKDRHGAFESLVGEL